MPSKCEQLITCAIILSYISAIDGLTYNFNFYGTGSGAIFLDNVFCSGNEADLFSCSYVMAQGDSHAEDVGVKCFETTSQQPSVYFENVALCNLYNLPNTAYPNCNLGDLRLVGGTTNREGRIEICIDGQWGTICDDGWSSFDARVACRQMGFAALSNKIEILSNCTDPSLIVFIIM